MYTPKHVKDKFFKLNFPELKKLAIKAGNLKAFKLYFSEDYKSASALLGVEDVFQFYLKLAKDEKTGKLHSNVAILIKELGVYLMSKICFPEEM